MRAPVLCAVLLCLCSGAAGSTLAGAAAPAATVTDASTAVDEPTQVTTTSTRLQTSGPPSAVMLTVYENGSTRWSFRYRERLDNESERQDFQAFADRFNSQKTDLYRGFVQEAEMLVRQGENATGREMNATDFSRQAYVETGPFADFGVVRMEFTWTGFAATSGDRVIVGDVFEGGLYLGADQQLVMHPGPNLVFSEVRPSGTWSNASSLRHSDTVTWTGERQFSDNRPHVVFVPETESNASAAGDGPPGTSSATRTTASTDASASPSGAFPLLEGMLLALVATAVLLVGARMRGPASDDQPAEQGASQSAPPDGHSESAPQPTAQESTGPSPGEAASSPGSETPGQTETERQASEPAPAITDVDLQPDEDRVVSLLRDNGGRMKQSNIVDETGWSKSKVSMLLSEMEEEGLIAKLRIGRENVVSLAGNEPDVAGSPFEDDSEST